jgi:hypothetical protein
MGKPKKTGRKSNAQTYRDAMAMARLVDVDCMQVEDAAKQLGLTRSTAYRLLSRARSLLLAPQVKADREAAAPAVNEWFEPMPRTTGASDVDAGPEPELPEVRAVVRTEPEMKLPPVEPVRPPVVEPPPDTSEAGRRREWRRQQVEKQMEENGYALTFRGRKKCEWEQDDNLEY